MELEKIRLKMKIDSKLINWAIDELDWDFDNAYNVDLMVSKLNSNLDTWLMRFARSSSI